MPKITKKLAEHLGNRPAFRGANDWPWEQVRDQVDMYTDGELDPWQLDKLTDWVREVAGNPKFSVA